MPTPWIARGKRLVSSRNQEREGRDKEEREGADTHSFAWSAAWRVLRIRPEHLTRRPLVRRHSLHTRRLNAYLAHEPLVPRLFETHAIDGANLRQEDVFPAEQTTWMKDNTAVSERSC
jgi:hypothetical protein